MERVTDNQFTRQAMGDRASQRLCWGSGVRFPTFKTAAEQNVHQRLPDSTAMLDGYPIVWTDVLQTFTTSAAVDSPIAVFGALSFWWIGEHGSPRLDTSEHVYFANDQLSMRILGADRRLLFAIPYLPFSI